MKKCYVLGALITISILFAYCNSSRKAAGKEVAKVTYEGSIQPLVAANCAPCHIPAEHGSKKALDTYAAASANADDVITRIQLNPTDRGFMPFKHPKLSDSTINVFVQWKADGLLEK